MADPLLKIDRSNTTTSVLTLNRPQKRNALNVALMESLCRELAALEAQPSCRVVILRGAGPVFCAGLDLQEASQSDLVDTSTQCVADVLERVVDCQLVTIAAVHGAAYAGGAGLMAACDFVVAADNVQICFPEVRRGLVPALVSTVLCERLRDAALRELLLLAEPIDAERALVLGLIDRVVPEKRVLDEAWQIARTVERGAPEATRCTKRLLRELRRDRRADLVAKAIEYHTQARSTDEAREGLSAFREKRETHW